MIEVVGAGVGTPCAVTSMSMQELNTKSVKFQYHDIVHLPVGVFVGISISVSVTGFPAELKRQ
jgi:hypothetical protein